MVFSKLFNNIGKQATKQANSIGTPSKGQTLVVKTSDKLKWWWADKEKTMNKLFKSLASKISVITSSPEQYALLEDLGNIELEYNKQIAELQEKLLRETERADAILNLLNNKRDTISRRNLQIADLKKCKAELKKLVSIICGSDREITLEDCDNAKQLLK